jgi:hypothetical protein
MQRIHAVRQLWRRRIPHAAKNGLVGSDHLHSTKKGLNGYLCGQNARARLKAEQFSVCACCPDCVICVNRRQFIAAMEPRVTMRDVSMEHVAAHLLHVACTEWPQRQMCCPRHCGCGPPERIVDLANLVVRILF